MNREDAAFCLTDAVMKARDEGKSTIAVYCDLSEAFATVHHERLLGKLHRLGFTGPALNLLRSHLTDRQQVYVTGGVTTPPAKISCGIPQGSVIGPLLFIIYMNDLPTQVRVPRFISFADDTCCPVQWEV